MILFYLLALIPLVIGGILFWRSDKIVWQEFAVSAAVALICAIGFNCYSYYSKISDVQTISGEINYVKRIPEWQEYYEEAIYRTEYRTRTVSSTDSKGNTTYRTETYSVQVFDHWEPRTCWHSEVRYAKSNIDTSYNISKQTYGFIKEKFGRENAKPESHSTMSHNSRQIGGDYNDYYLENINQAIIPVNEKSSWINKLLLDNTVYAFAPPPEGEYIPEYPISNNPWVSNRLIGSGYNFTNEDLDKVNAKVGYQKHCNLIIVNCDKNALSYSEWIKSKWRGGKQNDLIICFGGRPEKPTWVQIISWSESEMAKIEIRNLIMQEGMTKDALWKVKDVIIKKWNKRDWHDFDYIDVEPSGNDFIWYIVITIAVQGVLWAYFLLNEFGKNEKFGVDLRWYYSHSSFVKPPKPPRNPFLR